jgi:predicted DNA-binding transcriptional regulator AlpA
MATRNIPTTATPTPYTAGGRGGRTTTTPNGIAHAAPGMNAPGITPELLTTAEAATLAGVGERTFWAWSRSGLAPAPLKIGHGTRPAVRYRRAELLDWISAGCPRVDRGDNRR